MVSAYGWQPYDLNVPIVLKSGSLKLLEHSGSLQACNGISSPLPVEWKAVFVRKLDPVVKRQQYFLAKYECNRQVSHYWPNYLNWMSVYYLLVNNPRPPGTMYRAVQFFIWIWLTLHGQIVNLCNTRFNIKQDSQCTNVTLRRVRATIL